ncbi:hypothetical protein [Ostreibacterium oceani]|uniref:Uncharacterized protein n=1 Tax=Ostreibacterium oceani TaxID=2654998 RepID=A0A6N7EYF6_9GAMM|nr:hypothetical protein [Ostreibacterium oceani]MPV86983.1 hypothetical protein [Ostreibacterium oceani]
MTVNTSDLRQVVGNPSIGSVIGVVTLLLVLLIVISMVLGLHQEAGWIGENGIIETLSASGYFVCVLLMFVKGRWAYIKRYHYWLLLMVFFALRELDFDKQFTSAGILSSKLYVNASVPMLEKLIGLLVIGLLIFCLVAIIKHHMSTFYSAVKQGEFMALGGLFVVGLLVFSKILDGLTRNLADIGVIVSQQTAQLIELTEETTEFFIPMMIGLILWRYFSAAMAKQSTP